MIWCNFITVLVFGVFLALQPSASAAQAIGNVTSVKPQAEGVHGGSTRTLSTGVDVHASETIRTGEAGVAGLRFRDNSNRSTGSVAV
jgi:hypothetical protein